MQRMRKLLISFVALLVATGFSYAAHTTGIQKNVEDYWPKFRDGYKRCNDLRTSFYAQHMPKKYRINFTIVQKSGDKFISSYFYSDRIGAFFEIDQHVMNAQIRCNPVSKLPELIIPTAGADIYNILTFDTAERISFRTGQID